MPSRPMLVLAPAALVFFSTLALVAQEPSSEYPIWQGVFSEAQKNHGKEVYNTRCAGCHTEDLTGGEGPALIGGAFARNWSGHHVDRLFRKIQSNMPAEEPHSVSDADKLATMTYILWMNGFPTGPKALEPDMEAMSRMMILGKNGLAPPMTGAMVKVIGCLTKDAAGAYRLTNGQDAMVATLDDPGPNEKKEALASPAGPHTFRLVDVFPKPDALIGHKMMAKGLIIRADKDDQVNVLSLESLAPSCAPQ
jgi:hypothetical protein